MSRVTQGRRVGKPGKTMRFQATWEHGNGCVDPTAPATTYHTSGDWSSKSAAERKEGFIALPMRGGGDGGPRLDLHTFSEVHLHIKSSGNQAQINNQLHLLTYLEQVLGLCPFSEILK